MLLKKAKYKKVKVWQRKMISDEVHGCDCCKKVIAEFPNEAQILTLDVWKKKVGDDVKHLHFCSWKCLLKYIPKIKSEYFASLPFLYFDEGVKERTAKELIDLLKPLKL